MRDPCTHQEVLSRIRSESEKNNLYCWGLTYSPITGPEGNIEYLILLRQFPPEQTLGPEWRDQVVAEAFAKLKK